MITTSLKKYLIVILGPTAVGKTAVAIDVAKWMGTEILSSDSRQFYRPMKIGTAAPTEDEMAEVKHHFVGQLEVTDYYNVSSYEQDVLSLLDKLFVSHDHTVMVGGSGLYIDAVCKGIDRLPDPDEQLRTSLKKVLQQN